METSNAGSYSSYENNNAILAKHYAALLPPNPTDEVMRLAVLDLGFMAVASLADIARSLYKLSGRDD